jgi:hypothetical protein
LAVTYANQGSFKLALLRHAEDDTAIIFDDTEAHEMTPGV